MAQEEGKEDACVPALGLHWGGDPESPFYGGEK